eukprot:6943391-Prymnesium_polylepis.2
MLSPLPPPPPSSSPSAASSISHTACPTRSTASIHRRCCRLLPLTSGACDATSSDAGREPRARTSTACERPARR